MKKAEGDPDKPVHPWKELTLQENRLLQGSGSKTESEYLATPEVMIIGKKEVLVDVDGGRSSYAFQLNCEPDSMWRHLLSVQVYDMPDGINRSDVRVEVRENTIFLYCMPSNLEAKYAFVKTAIARTNEEYQKEKEVVLTRVRDTDAEKKHVTSSGKTKVEMVKERFNNLEL